MGQVDAWDEERDATRYAGRLPVIAHPPCRAWGRYAQRAKPIPGEKELALFAVAAVRRWGGVLEHPAHSTLWKEAKLPEPGARDEFGGWTIGVYQGEFGHRAPKATFIYVVGVEPGQVPDLPYSLEEKAGRIESMGRAEREATPDEFARWLVDLVSQVKGGQGG